MNSFLIDQAVRATLLLIAAYVATFAMRRASASARRLVWIATAVCLLTMPLLSLLVPPIGARASISTFAAPPSMAVAANAVRNPMTAFPKPRPGRRPWIPMLWAAGALA